METKKKLKILLLSTGEFSGVRPVLAAALNRAGCETVCRRQTLRELGPLRYWYALRTFLSAIFVYRANALRMRHRTYAAYVAMSKVNKSLVENHPQIDAVIQIAGNYDTYWGPRPPGIRFAIYTDYMNLLSKTLPDRGFALKERLTYPGWNELERRTLIAQDHVFVMGSHVKPAIERAYRLSGEKIAVVGAGPALDVDIERDGYEKDYDARNILFVGKAGDRKGLPVLLKAFARVTRTYPDAILHVITDEAIATQENVVFHGRLEHPPLKELFYSANIFVMPAYKEPLGLVFIEAMWAKAACIGTTAGSMPELIRHGETGYLVEQGDEAGLANRIDAMLGNPQRTRQMTELAYAAAKSYWQWDAVVERMLSELASPRGFEPRLPP